MNRDALKFDTPQQIIDRHNAAVGAGDLDAVAADYADDAVFVNPRGALRGHAGIKQAFTEILQDFPDGTEFDIYNTVFEGDVLFLEWRARTATTQVDDGVDTFLFRDGKIVVQTVRYTKRPR